VISPLHILYFIFLSSEKQDNQERLNAPWQWARKP